MFRKYHNHKLQTNPWYREEEPHTTVTRRQEDKLSKATSSLFPIKMTAKLEGTQRNVEQNIEQLHTPTIGVTINNKSTTLCKRQLNLDVLKTKVQFINNVTAM